jgi:phosphate transport system permease protein
MTDIADNPNALGGRVGETKLHTGEAAEKRLRRRYAAEARFKIYGLVAVSFAILMLFILIADVVRTSIPAYTQTFITLEIDIDPAVVDPQGTRDPAAIQRANYQELVSQALYAMFPEVEGRVNRKQLRDMVSPAGSFALRRMVTEDPSLIGQRISLTFQTSDDVDQFDKDLIDRTTPEDRRRMSDQQIAWYDQLKAEGLIERQFNWNFFTGSNSKQPELAGIWAAVLGSFWTLLVTLALSFPIAVATAIYLEEFAPKNRLTDLIEVNINNLAAVPSIVFGLLGLAVFINFFGLPYSVPLVGGMVIALMSLPLIIIAARAAIKAVPPSIREAALGVGASKLQTVTHHVLPLAMPGILTGVIVAMAAALGETAPLILVGMVVFVTTYPDGVLSPATVLPGQIYSWADAPERGFESKTAAAIVVLLVFLLAMNSIAIYLRKKFERRW